SSSSSFFRSHNLRHRVILPLLQTFRELVRQLRSIAASSGFRFRTAPALSASGDKTWPHARSRSPSSRPSIGRGSRAGATPDKASLAEPGPRRARLDRGVARSHTREQDPARQLSGSTGPTCLGGDLISSVSLLSPLSSFHF